MKILRINLHIRSDISPQLYETLAALPPRPRAELLRRLAELGLRPIAVTTSSTWEETPARKADTPNMASASDRELFGAELLRVVGGLP